ncbi:unnamed protein product [Prorocentrum cordatum]|uniref:Mcm6 C-terminal winged-helix domain-containing protein n=1 Tax=Prorocentrum cordatum TaxID=2364126 RepID=A0ABN9Q1N2_9DINO|nr:unnamed protein product [Polarella glacialis]
MDEAEVAEEDFMPSAERVDEGPGLVAELVGCGQPGADAVVSPPAPPLPPPLTAEQEAVLALEVGSEAIERIEVRPWAQRLFKVLWHLPPLLTIARRAEVGAPAGAASAAASSAGPAEAPGPAGSGVAETEAQLRASAGLAAAESMVRGLTAARPQCGRLRVAQQERADVEVKEGDLITWYMEQIEDSIQTQVQLLEQQHLIQAVINRMIDKDRVIVVVRPAEDPLRPEGRVLIKHPNVIPGDVIAS